jgi:hypothetical protein
MRRQCGWLQLQMKRNGGALSQQAAAAGHCAVPCTCSPRFKWGHISVLLRFPALFEQGRNVEDPRPGIRQSCVTSSAVGYNAVRSGRFLCRSGSLAIALVVL